MLSVISRLTSCAALLCRACGNLTACVAERYLTLRTGCEKHGRKNPLPYPISERSHVGNLRQIRKQGKGRSSKRKGNRRCPFLFALRRGRGESPRSAERSSPLRFSEKLPARQGRTRLRQFVCPGQPVQKRSRPSGANPPAAVRVPRSAGAAKGAARIGRTRLRQFVCPGQPVQQKEPPVRSGHANAVRVPRSADAEKEPPVRGEPACGSSCAPLSRCRKGAARIGRTRLRQFVCPGHLVPRKEKHRRIASTVLKVCTFTQIAAAYRHPYAPAPAGPVPDDRAR